MQHCPRKSAPPCLAHQKLEDSLPDAGAAELREYRHSSNFYFDPAVDDEPTAPDRTVIQECKRVNRVLIVVVQLKLLRNMLLLDKDAPPDCVGVGHSLRGFDRDDAGGACHVLLLSAPLLHRQI